MIWKLQTSPVFWIPVPANGQELMKLTEWQRSAEAQPVQMELTDPETKQPYRVEILDYLGPYPMDNLPSFLARQIAGKKLTGNLLSVMLRKKKEEFREVQKIYFYQVNPIK